jgi:hypothetical protein
VRPASLLITLMLLTVVAFLGGIVLMALGCAAW